MTSCHGESLQSESRHNGPPRPVCQSMPARIVRLLQEIEQNPADDWSATTMARKAMMSRSTFFHRFREATGLTPLDYIVSVRMRLACELLDQQAASVKQIARQVGYETASSFSSAFKRRFGCSPMCYRELGLTENSAVI